MWTRRQMICWLQIKFSAMSLRMENVSQYGQKKRYKDTLKTFLEDFTVEL